MTPVFDGAHREGYPREALELAGSIPEGKS